MFFFFACGLAHLTHDCKCEHFFTGDRQSVPKLPGFRWLYHLEGKRLHLVLPLQLPLLTSMKNWVTPACESTLTLYCLSLILSIPPVPMTWRYSVLLFRFLSLNFRFKLSASTTALVFYCFNANQDSNVGFKITSLLSSKITTGSLACWPQTAICCFRYISSCIDESLCSLASYPWSTLEVCKPQYMLSTGGN